MTDELREIIWIDWTVPVAHSNHIDVRLTGGRMFGRREPAGLLLLSHAAYGRNPHDLPTVEFFPWHMIGRISFANRTVTFGENGQLQESMCHPV